MDCKFITFWQSKWIKDKEKEIDRIKNEILK
jgi:hypothetical protein